jgi:hypothetical protein
MLPVPAAEFYFFFRILRQKFPGLLKFADAKGSKMEYIDKSDLSEERAMKQAQLSGAPAVEAGAQTR